ncbi:acyl carrier protein [Helicobacter sp. NHP22-001]|uniref:acyl carrier protein n=1 Tax=Helicobacter sp. NHP22-001 TaxID=3040202 RepID=UPI00244D80C3|nr:acyl carrier protein [Helicobacter sp. NHP22-001]GMB96716.1 acyl carrier protein [Helicobacter sp. NHP22-001]
METTQIFSQLQEVFRDIFDDSSLVINESTNANDIEDWDSLNHISLISAIEKHFKIKFHLSELQGLKNVGEMVALIERKLEHA